MAIVREGYGASDYYFNVDNIDVPYPASPSANDLLILQVCFAHNAVRTVNTPSGWTLIGSVYTGGGDIGVYGFYKLASGSESGTLNVTTDYSCYKLAGRMYRYSGINTSTPVESANATYDTSGATAIASMSVTDNDSFAILMICDEYDHTFDNDATYYSEVNDETFVGGAQLAMAYYEDNSVASGTEPADSLSHSGGYTAYLQFIIRPAAAAGYGNKVNGVASASIGKVNGVATANISKVCGS